jgi:hypothetical protein
MRVPTTTTLHAPKQTTTKTKTTNQKPTELEVRYVPILAPTIGAPLGRVGAACAELLGLEVLKLCGGPTPPVECVEVRG